MLERRCVSRSFATSDARVRPPVVSVSNLPVDDTFLSLISLVPPPVFPQA